MLEHELMFQPGAHDLTLTFAALQYLRTQSHHMKVLSGSAV